MVKILISMVLTVAVAFASDSYLSEMDSLISDAKTIEKALVSKSLESLSTDSDIESKLSSYEAKTSAFLEKLAGDITDPAVAEGMLNKSIELSNSCVSLSDSLVKLADSTSTNANSSYLKTLETLTKTTLRLSDDIGVMADRIGEMADRIGEMADRIVYTEELISKNAQMINDSTLTVIEKFDFEQPQRDNSSMDVSPNVPAPMAPPSMPGAPF